MLTEIVGRFQRLYQVVGVFVRQRYKQIVVVLLAIVLVQLLYPGSLSKPLVFSSGKYLGFSSSNKLSSHYSAHLEKSLHLKLDDSKHELKLAEVGINVDTNKAMAKASRDAIWQRLIPLSILWPVSMQANNWQSVDDKKLDEFATKRSAEHYQAPKNAGAARGETGEYVLSPSERGRQISKETIITSLKNNHIERNQSIELKSEEVDPAVNDEIVKAVIERTKLANIQPIDFSVADKKYKISAETIQPWLTVEIDEAKKQARLGYDDVAIEAWINGTIALVNTGKPTVITLRDGVEISKTEGVAGKGIDKKKAQTDIKNAIEAKQAAISGEIVTLPVGKQVIRTYSSSSNGINVLIDEWFKEYPGMQAGVYLRELSGRGISAERNSGTSMFAASVYKLWVAEFVLQHTDLNQEAYSGKTYGQCLDLMIRVSDNTCPHKIIDKHGSGTLNSYVHGQGFTQTSLSENTTSPRDAGRFLERLYSGSLMDGGKTSRLLGLLHSQIYRSGIPAGSPGASVADKPGFYGGSWHDAAIVEGSGSTYVLVIMTKGPGVLAVKTLAQRIYQTLN